jgi:hypothetical protein
VVFPDPIIINFILIPEGPSIAVKVPGCKFPYKLFKIILVLVTFIFFPLTSVAGSFIF